MILMSKNLLSMSSDIAPKSTNIARTEFTSHLRSPINPVDGPPLAHHDLVRGRDFAVKAIPVILLLIAAPLSAQPAGTSQPGGFRHDARVQLYLFDNFFHSSNPATEQDVLGLGAEYRAAWRPAQRPMEVFGHVNVLEYDESGLETAFGVRLGLQEDGARHDWRAYLDQSENRPSFDVRNTFATTDRTTLFGGYGFDVTPSWQLGADVTLEQQRFENNPTRENEFAGIGANVRYKGFGWRIVPMAGVAIGDRSVEDENESYDDRSWILGIEYIPIDPLYLSASYRDTLRDYGTGDPSSFNFGREEDRQQWEVIASYRTSQRISLSLYYLREGVDVPLTGENFDTQLVLFGVGYAF